MCWEGICRRSFQLSAFSSCSTLTGLVAAFENVQEAISWRVLTLAAWPSVLGNRFLGLVMPPGCPYLSGLCRQVILFHRLSTLVSAQSFALAGVSASSEVAEPARGNVTL